MNKVKLQVQRIENGYLFSLVNDLRTIKQWQSDTPMESVAEVMAIVRDELERIHEEQKKGAE